MGMIFVSVFKLLYKSREISGNSSDIVSRSEQNQMCMRLNGSAAGRIPFTYLDEQVVYGKQILDRARAR